MWITIPDPQDPASRPLWWAASIDIHRRKPIGSVVDIFVRAKWISFQVRYNATVDDPVRPRFVRQTRYGTLFIVHPNGGSAQRLKCEGCGAEYPFPQPTLRGLMSPCGFCAVERETSVRVWWKPRISVVALLDYAVGKGSMYGRQWEWKWKQRQSSLRKAGNP